MPTQVLHLNLFYDRWHTFREASLSQPHRKHRMHQELFAQAIKAESQIVSCKPPVKFGLACLPFVHLFAAVLLTFCSASTTAAAAQPPNIVFIFVDDQGYYDLGCYGASEVKTPRIDALAQAGTRFTDYYAAAPICSPSRAGLLTGCYPRRVGNETWVHRADSRAGIKVPEGRVIDGRDISPLLKGETTIVPPPGMKKSLNAAVPLRRRWDPPGEWGPIINRNEYNDAFFYHGSQGALAAVRWQNWKLVLNPSLQLYNLANDPGESNGARNPEITRKLRGMAILFQEEMRLDARPAGLVPPQPHADGRTEIPMSTLASLDSKLDVTYARYGDRTLSRRALNGPAGDVRRRERSGRRRRQSGIQQCHSSSRADGSSNRLPFCPHTRDFCDRGSRNDLEAVSRRFLRRPARDVSPRLAACSSR
ncbi:Arylsulfatase [Novipirellula artificiosorum]|uniref:Arylsulfatase n=1 Tax=Novipirellula artificiosorum TaxID=2528016 RepID=A0A5C6DQW6_9BACT|nr:Arylsulfatase [Novipirellula artificiosorum]